MTSIAAEVNGHNRSEVFPRPLSLSAKEFAIVSALAREQFGLELGEGKQQLVSARLGKLMRQLGFGNFREFYDHVQNDRSGQTLCQLIDALTTNHTSFFREPAHFDFLVNKILPERQRSSPMRIWSAASSTGEEPYSIALSLREHLGVQEGAQILASDISGQALDAARKGIYRADRFPAEVTSWLKKYLLRGQGSWDGWYRICPEILGMVEFQRINLIQPLPDIGQFAVIFCRNVMIYFSRQTQEQLVNRLANCLEPGGYLFVGHSESLTGMCHDLQHIQPAIYRKRSRK